MNLSIFSVSLILILACLCLPFLNKINKEKILEKKKADQEDKNGGGSLFKEAERRIKAINMKNT